MERKDHAAADFICIIGGFCAVIFVVAMNSCGLELPLPVFPAIVIFLALTGALFSGEDVRKVLHLTPSEPTNFLKGIGYFLLMFISMTLANYITQWICCFLNVTLEPQTLVEEAKSGSWSDFFQIAATAVVFAPIAEELYFRGALFRRLKTVLPDFLCIGITAIFFAAAHANLQTMASLLIMSVFLSREYLRTNSVRNCILFHISNNLIAVIQILILRFSA